MAIETQGKRYWDLMKDTQEYIDELDRQKLETMQKIKSINDEINALQEKKAAEEEKLKFILDRGHKYQVLELAFSKLAFDRNLEDLVI